MKQPYGSLIRPVLVLFGIVTVLLFAFMNSLDKEGVDTAVVLGANLLLFLITLANLYFLSKNLHNNNPNAVVRGMMAGTLLKLLVLAAAFLVYLLLVKEKKNPPAVYIGMALYSLYTWLEVRISLRLNKKN